MTSCLVELIIEICLSIDVYQGFRFKLSEVSREY